jgi:hypothetical protein
MSTKYTAATEVEILAFDLIGENHPHLLGIPILYVFAVPTPTSLEIIKRRMWEA